MAFIIRGGGGQHSSLTNIESVNCMKAVAAILIVLSHAHYYISFLGILKVFKPFGYIGVSLFFFCSGYGVMKKYIRNEHYLDGFLTKKLKSVYIPYIVATTLWFAMNLLLFRDFDGTTAILSVTESVLLIKTRLPFAWYVLAILIWYFVFFMVAKIVKKPDIMVKCLFVINVAWYFVGISTKVDSFYYNGTCCLIIGCIVAIKEDELEVPGRWAFLCSAVGLCSSIVILHFYGEKSALLYTVIVAISSTLFVLFLYIAGYYFKFYSNATKYIGRYSYEIYLTQGIAYVVSKELSGRFNGTFWIIFVMTMGILVFLDRKMVNLFNRLGG